MSVKQLEERNEIFLFILLCFILFKITFIVKYLTISQFNSIIITPLMKKMHLHPECSFNERYAIITTFLFTTNKSLTHPLNSTQHRFRQTDGRCLREALY